MTKYLSSLRLVTALFFLTFISPGSFAQDSLSISETVELMSQGKQNGFQIVIPHNSAKESEKLWKKFMKDETKESVKNEDDELVIHNALLNSFGNDLMSVYAAFKDADGRTLLSVFFSGVDSVFISSAKHEALCINAKLLVRNFAVYAYKDGVSNMLKEEVKKLDEHESYLKEIEKNINSSEDKIKKNNREIDNAKEEIKTLKTQEDFLTSEILKQKQLLTTFSGSAEARAIDEKKLEDLEKEKKKISRNIEKAHNSIDKLEGEIRNLEKQIDTDKNKNIPEKQGEIKSQKETVTKIEKLLENIR